MSNSRLCKAALDRGLDKFILTKVFTCNKWRPRGIDAILEEVDLNLEKETREMASKTVADVVESLIGAGWRMGHYPIALSIVKTFLPEVDLPSLEIGRERLYDIARVGMILPANLIHLEQLAGYTFKKKSLLIQSMSHRSYRGNTVSYERLEFLGDAILENIIVDELLKYEDQLSHSLMHLYRTTLVHADYLGFIALEWKITQKNKDLIYDPVSRRMTEVDSEFFKPLWRFMRHESMEIGSNQRKVERQHASLRDDILYAIESGTEYPWALLAKLHVNKFYSDIVESLLAAVWVDSGSLDTCKQVLGRMGILKHMQRLIQEKVHVLHPREELCILADGKEVNYEPKLRKTDEDCDEWTCAVFVGERKVAEVSEGVTENEVKTKVAEIAVSLLRFEDGRSGSPVSYGERIPRFRNV